jgi:hypothetical protein
LVEYRYINKKKAMAKKMTIETLVEITANEFRAVGKRFDSIESTMKEGFGIVLDELRGLRDDVKQTRATSRAEYPELKEKVESLEEGHLFRGKLSQPCHDFFAMIGQNDSNANLSHENLL